MLLFSLLSPATAYWFYHTTVTLRFILSLFYLVTICSRKVSFQTETMSFLPPLSMNLLSLNVSFEFLAQELSSFDCPLPKQSNLFVTLVRAVNGQWRELWHQSINIICLSRVTSFDSLFEKPWWTRGCYSEPICCVYICPDYWRGRKWGRKES